MTVLIEPAGLVAAALECDAGSIGPESGLGRHPAWDSVGHLAIMLALEAHYGVEISDQTIRRFESYDAIVACYEHRLRQAP